MKLSSYIEKHGDHECSIMFNVKVRTVASWRRGERFPRVDQARLIVDVTGGDVSFSDIFGGGESEKAAA